MSTEKYDRQAESWTAEAYADPAAYLAHRAELVATLGPELVAGDTVLDLACGDGGLGGPLVARGLHYAGVDLSAAMAAAARERLGSTADVRVGDLNTYVPPAPVACTTCFRAVYYAAERSAFFRHVAAFTEKKLVFDLNPRQFAVADVRRDLESAGLGRVELRPFFAPQRVSLPRLLAPGVYALERSGPLARALLRLRFTYLVAAAPR